MGGDNFGQIVFALARINMPINRGVFQITPSFCIEISFSLQSRNGTICGASPFRNAGVSAGRRN